jgi:hypothetical protein
MSIFDAVKVVVKRDDKDKERGGNTIRVTIHGDKGQTTVLNIWRDADDDAPAPELVVEQ